MSEFWAWCLRAWLLLAEMAPYLLAGFLAAGFLHVLLDPRWIEHSLGRPGWKSNLLATVFGVPLPICSCGVLPLAAGLRREGASPGATVAFLTATPQTGVDSILATHALMGPVFAGFRLAVAFLSGWITGAVVDAVTRGQPDPGPGKGRPGEAKAASREGDCCAAKTAEAPAVSSCCGGGGGGGCGCGGKTEAEERQAKPSGGTCCGGGHAAGGHTGEEQETTAGGRGKKGGARWGEALHYGLVRLPRDLAGALLFGLGLAALLGAVPLGWIEPVLAYPWLVYAGVTLLAVPLYVCSTGSIPLAFSLLGMGFSPGAALVLLITGPATNAATLTVLARDMGLRVLLAFLGSLVGCAWAAGWVLDRFFADLILTAPHEHTHDSPAFWFYQICAGVLLVVLGNAVWPKGKGRTRGYPPAGGEEGEEENCKVEAGAGGSHRG